MKRFLYLILLGAVLVGLSGCTTKRIVNSYNQGGDTTVVIIVPPPADTCWPPGHCKSGKP
jgi:hypothetical protein